MYNIQFPGGVEQEDVYGKEVKWCNYLGNGGPKGKGECIDIEQADLIRY